jgi:hypothetical protein
MTLQRAAGNAAVRTLLPRIEPSVQRQAAPAGGDAAFKKAVAASDWTGAAIAVNGFSDADILTRLRALPAAQTTQIYTAALRSMTGATRERFTVLVPQVGLPIAYDGALAAPDWLWTVLHLNGFSDADIATRVTALNPTQRQQLRDGMPFWALRVRSAVLDADFKAAVTASDWTAAASAVNGFNDPDMLAHLRSIPFPQVSQVYTAALRTITGPTRDRFVTLVPQVDLGAATTGALVADAWLEASRHLNGFNEPDLNARITAMSQTDRLAMLPEVEYWNLRVRWAVLRAVATAEIANSDFTNAILHLNDLPEPYLLALLTPLPIATLTLMGNIAMAMYISDSNNPVRRAIAFVLTAQGPRPGNVIAGAVPGLTWPATAVDGGTAAVSTTTTIPGTATPDWFAVTYQDAAGGAQAPNTGWVQFIAIEIESFDEDGDSLGFETSPNLPAAVAGFPITPSEPGSYKWYVDTLGANAPFYEAPTAGGGPGSGGAHQTTPNMTAMYDRPSSDPNVVNAMFARRKVKKVVERERFHDYLVRGMDVLYRSELYVRFEWTAAPGVGAADPPRLNVPVYSGKVDRMLPDQYANLISRYPAHSYFPH